MSALAFDRAAQHFAEQQVSNNVGIAQAAALRTGSPKDCASRRGGALEHPSDREIPHPSLLADLVAIKLTPPCLRNCATHIIVSEISWTCTHRTGARCSAGSREGEISEGKQAASNHADTFDTAYRSLREDGGTQFSLPAVVPEAPPPAWLEAFGRLLKAMFEPIGHLFAWIGSFLPDAPFARILLWS